MIVEICANSFESAMAAKTVEQIALNYAHNLQLAD